MLATAIAVVFLLDFGFHLIASLISLIALAITVFIFIACLHMPGGIRIAQWVIADVAIPVQVLWIGIARHNGIRTQKVACIRRTRLLPLLTKRLGINTTQPPAPSARS